MPRPLHVINRILRALLTLGGIGLFFARDTLGEHWSILGVIAAITAVGLSPALWPALPDRADKPIPPRLSQPAPPAPQPPQNAYQPPAQQAYQPVQQQYQAPAQGTTYGGQTSSPQQWPGQQQHGQHPQ
ncbi:hypothetical protein AB0I28_18335 [Phytomonospora sp. NPDC050363]|uniref:hypothetical protein n=1 Tax=Phytomonospora sp. NPDC050363 TaxID=3155642 RepID=UPI0033C6D37B